VGTLDMAVWDAVAKIEGKPLFRQLAERYGREANPSVFVYAAGGYYYPGKDNTAVRAEMRGYLDRGYNVVTMKIGGASILRMAETICNGITHDRAEQDQVAVGIAQFGNRGTEVGVGRLVQSFRHQLQVHHLQLVARAIHHIATVVPSQNVIRAPADRHGGGARG
jgi:hypothetical protein